MAGCATVRPPVSVEADFRLRGKIAVRDAEAAFSASFDWVQRGRAFDVELWGPLGQGRVRLQGDGTRLTVTDSRGAETSEVDVQSFMASRLGWSAPLSALPHWVRGRYDPAGPVADERRAPDGALTGFEQFGWTVEVSDWSESALGPLPGKVVAARAGAGRKVVIVCKEWSVG